MGHELAVGGKAADCQPMWVTMWIRQLTHILTHTFFSIFTAKKHRKPKFSMLFGAGGVTRTPGQVFESPHQLQAPHSIRVWCFFIFEPHYLEKPECYRTLRLFSLCGRNRRMKYGADRRRSPLLAKQVRGCGGCKQTRPDPNGSSRLIGGQTGRYQLNCFLISAFTLSRSLQVKIGISRLISSMLLSHHLNLSSNSISSSSKRF